MSHETVKLNPSMASATYTTQQGSRLLSLPAELRIQIYELVREELQEAVIVYDDGEPTFSDAQHPLSRSCQQLREEFSSFALDTAQSSAIIKMRCKNFDMPDAGSMQRFFRALPPLPGDADRQYLQRIIIGDNDFARDINKKLENVLPNLYGDVEHPGMVICTAWIQFDITSVSLESLTSGADALDKGFGWSYAESELWDALSYAVGCCHRREWKLSQARAKAARARKRKELAEKR